MNSFLYPHKSSQKQDEKEILRTTMEKLHVLKLRTKMLDCNGSLGFSCIDLMRPYQCLCYIKWKPILQQSWYSSSSSIQLFFMYVSLCLGTFWILKCPGTGKYKEMNMNISFIFFTFLTLASKSESNDDLPQIQVTVQTKEDDHHVYSSESLVDVEVGEKIYFTCQSKVSHRIISSFNSQVSPIPIHNANQLSPIIWT